MQHILLIRRVSYLLHQKMKRALPPKESKHQQRGSKLKAPMGLLKGFRPVSDHPRGQVGDSFFETDLNKLKLLLYVRIMERGHR